MFQLSVILKEVCACAKGEMNYLTLNVMVIQTAP